jgi:putative flavoprotein involved in K+ transport
MIPEFVESIVIGGGQAGLSMSYHLRQNGREHVILERGRVAERWRSERWESLSFQFPNWMVRLPGFAYDGAQPDGFMGRDEVVSFIANYARQCSAPIRCGVNASSVSLSGQGRLLVQAGQKTMEAANVIVATGPYQLPSIPPESARLPAGIQQVTANRYTCSAELPPCNILVVGSGGSGAQIVEDLVHEGRIVYFSVRRHRLIPLRYRGHDVGWWLEQTGMTDRTLETIPPDWRAPLMTGVNGGRTVDLRDMASQGVTLVGSLRDIRDARVFFATDLNANLNAGDETFSRFVNQSTSMSASMASTRCRRASTTQGSRIRRQASPRLKNSILPPRTSPLSSGPRDTAMISVGSTVRCSMRRAYRCIGEASRLCPASSSLVCHACTRSNRLSFGVWEKTRPIFPSKFSADNASPLCNADFPKVDFG